MHGQHLTTARPRPLSGVAGRARAVRRERFDGRGAVEELANMEEGRGPIGLCKVQLCLLLLQPPASLAIRGAGILLRHHPAPAKKVHSTREEAAEMTSLTPFRPWTRHHCRGCGDIFCGSKTCSGLDVNCSHRGYKTPQRVCIICASQKYALLISQTQAGAAELLLARSNFEAAITAAEAGVAANKDYDERTIVDPGEAANLTKAMAKMTKTLEIAHAAKAIQDKARAEITGCFEEGTAAMEVRDWDSAMEAFEAGLNPDLRTQANGEKGWQSCFEHLDRGLNAVVQHRGAEGDARELASGSLSDAESAMIERDWERCAAACEIGLQNATVVNDQALTGKLEALLGLSLASEQLVGGQAAMAGRKYEVAIAAFEAGLAQQTSTRGDDGGLSTTLQGALDEAAAAKKAQDAARDAAWEHFNEADGAMAGEIGSDTIESAVKHYTGGLALKEATNGDGGWDTCIPQLAENLVVAQAAKQAQDEARASAQKQLATGEQLASEAAAATSDPEAASAGEQAARFAEAAAAYKRAAEAFALGLQQPTNQAELTAKLESLRQKVTAERVQVVAQEKHAAGDAKLEEGAAAVEAGSGASSPADRVKHHWKSAEAFVGAIKAFTAGLDRAVEDGVSKEQIAKLTASCQTAKLELRRAAARKEMSEAEVKLEEGVAANTQAGLLDSPAERGQQHTASCEAFTAAIALFEGAQKHPTQSGELDQALASGREAAVLELVRGTAWVGLSEAQGQLGALEFCAAIMKCEETMQQNFDSVELTSKLRETIDQAHQQAQKVAIEKLEEGDGCMAAQQWKEAVRHFEIGLKDQAAFGDAELVTKLEAALARAAGRSQHAEAVAMLEDMNYEAAIGAVNAGLAAKSGDSELKGLLMHVHEEASAKKATQDAARAEAQHHCDEGDKLFAGFDGRIRWKDSVEKAIVEYNKGLELEDRALKLCFLLLVAPGCRH